MTPDQEQWIESLVCERISADEQNDTLRLAFENSKLEYLSDYIARPDLMELDLNGDQAIYVIKDDRQLLAFFTLQCGNVFARVIKEEDKEFYDLFKAKPNLTKAQQEKLNNYQALHDLSDLEMKRRIDEIEAKIERLRPKKNDEAKYETGEDVTLVSDTFPGIEIVYLCKNESYQGNFADLFPDTRLGVVLFMCKIVPILKQIHGLIGCKFVYLFAATNERDEKLIAHYSDNFGFKPNPGYGVNKSLHVSGCVFMAQQLTDLFHRAKEFEPNSTPPIDD